MRRDMPAMFGPSLMPDVTHVPAIEAAAISFETTADAAAPLLPRFFSLPDRPLITITRMLYTGVDYMGGRGYAELVLSVSAVYEGPEGRLQGNFLPVLWVDDVSAIIAGREYMGYAKLGGQIEDVADSGDQLAFECREYGTNLMRGTLSNLRELDEQRLARVSAAGSSGVAFGWKYISGPQGAVDADYPTSVVNRWIYERAWVGEGRMEWFTPNAAEAPFSSRILSVFAALPVLEYRPAFRGQGHGEIDRQATRRLAAA